MTMTKIFDKERIRAVLLVLLFVISGVGASVLVNPAYAAPNSSSSSAAGPVAAASPLSQAEANWEYPNGNSYNQDFSPQNQINSSNLQYLGLQWIYPIAGLPFNLGAFFVDHTSTVAASVLIVNGTAFATTGYDTTYAINVQNGNLLWTFEAPIQQNKSIFSLGVPIHMHDGDELFTTATFGGGVSGPTYWFQGDNAVVYALNALTGQLELNFSDFNYAMVPGNNPQSVCQPHGASDIAINEQLGILVTGLGAETTANNGRGFFVGWNLNTNPPTEKWLTTVVPPQPNSNVPLNPYWAEQNIANMSQNAETFYPGKAGTTGGELGYASAAELAGGVIPNVNDNIVVNWKHLSSAQLNASLYNDWGQSFQSAQCLAIDGGGSTGSTGSAWGGSWIVGSGPTAGYIITATNNKDPYDSACTPGPDLWSASVMALNMSNGKWIWAFQTTAHDLWDYDCSWYQGLANEVINGVNTQVVIKTCKNGWLYEINAVTGDLIWAWDPPSGVETPGPSHCPVCWPFNPQNSSMMNADFPSAITNCAPAFTQSCLTSPSQPVYLQWPSLLAGFEDEQAYSPDTNMIYAVSQVPLFEVGYAGLNASTYFTRSGFSIAPCSFCTKSNQNATVWAIDASTGAVVWNHIISLQGYRGSIEVSGNVVYVPLSSGDIQMLNAQTGQLLRDYYVGAPMQAGVSIGASVDGVEHIIVPIGFCGDAAVQGCGNTPGDIIALTLAPPSATTASTTTVVSTTTATTTTVSVSTAPATVSTTTIVSTSISASSSGANNTVLYAVAAVAVIFIIISGYLGMTRGRKPAS